VFRARKIQKNFKLLVNEALAAVSLLKNPYLCTNF
jgi:hypothetical protein